MKITKPGTRPPVRVYTMRCTSCGCEAELETDALGTGSVECPMEWCGFEMVCIKESPAGPLPRTKADVLADRNSARGCCNRHADNMPCDCMERAV